MVVEDDLASREFLRISLQKKGYLVVSVDGVEAAQKQLGELGFDAFDCVVSDYRMAWTWLTGWRKKSPTSPRSC